MGSHRGWMTRGRAYSHPSASERTPVFGHNPSNISPDPSHDLTNLCFTEAGPQCDLASAHTLRCPQVPSSAPTAPAMRNCSVARARTSPAPRSASGSRRCCRRGEAGGAGIVRGGTEGAERSFLEAGGRDRPRDLTVYPKPGEGRGLTPVLRLLERTAPLERAPLTTPFRG